MQSEKYVTIDEWERFRRYHKEQFELVGVQLIEMKRLVENMVPPTPMAAQTKNLLARQVDKVSRKIMFLESMISKIKIKIGMKE